MKAAYLPPLFLPALLSVPGPTLPWPDGFRASPLLAPPMPLLMPVVVPFFMLFDLAVLDLVAPGPTLPSLEAPGAGCICADATSEEPTSDAMATATTANLDRMRILPRTDSCVSRNVNQPIEFRRSYGGGYSARCSRKVCRHSQ